jgi:hypothetical protein
VVVVAVVVAPDDLLVELPPLAASATPAPPSASVVIALASRTVCLGRNTWTSFRSWCSYMETRAAKSRPRGA